MTFEEINRYFVPALMNIYGGDSWANARKFEDLVGSSMWSKRYHVKKGFSRLPLTEQEKNLLIAMASPHWETLLKVYKIRKEYKDVNMGVL